MTYDRREADRRYNASEKGKARRRRYKQSHKARERNYAFDRTPKGRARKLRYDIERAKREGGDPYLRKAALGEYEAYIATGGPNNIRSWLDWINEVDPLPKVNAIPVTVTTAHQERPPT